MGSISYHVGQRIKKYRKSRGYTIEQFSAMINKSKATLSKYENGVRVPPTETLMILADYYGVSMDYIMGRTDCPAVNRKGDSA